MSPVEVPTPYGANAVSQRLSFQNKLKQIQPGQRSFFLTGRGYVGAIIFLDDT